MEKNNEINNPQEYIYELFHEAYNACSVTPEDGEKEIICRLSIMFSRFISGLSENICPVHLETHGCINET